LPSCFSSKESWVLRCKRHVVGRKFEHSDHAREVYLLFPVVAKRSGVDVFCKIAPERRASVPDPVVEVWPTNPTCHRVDRDKKRAQKIYKLKQKRISPRKIEMSSPISARIGTDSVSRKLR